MIQLYIWGIRGSARLYLSDPEYSAPNAKLDSFQILALPDGLLTPDPIALLSTIRPITKQYFRLVELPGDYSERHIFFLYKCIVVYGGICK